MRTFLIYDQHERAQILYWQ